VWKQSIELAKAVYDLTRGFASSEMYGLTSQMRRAAVSIPSNIAEGAARNSDKELIQFLYIALGSLAELETQYILSKEFGYTDDCVDLEKGLQIVRTMLLGLIKHLKNKL
jgi:four helix bundle protein